jgi:hypothetical protein
MTKDDEKMAEGAAAAAAAPEAAAAAESTAEAPAADGEAKEEGKKKAAAKPKKEKKAPPTPTRTSTRERRTRKEADIFNPEDFTKVDHTPTIVDGRGAKLADLQLVREHVESLKAASDDLFMAHKFLYSGRGKPPVRDIKRNILLFTGFLEKHADGVSDEDKVEKDDAAEVRLKSFIECFLTMSVL